MVKPLLLCTPVCPFPAGIQHGNQYNLVSVRWSRLRQATLYIKCFWGQSSWTGTQVLSEKGLPRPSTLSDLNPCGYFLWSSLKNWVFQKYLHKTKNWKLPFSQNLGEFLQQLWQKLCAISLLVCKSWLTSTTSHPTCFRSTNAFHKWAEMTVKVSRRYVI
jgi:hypothetical protein